MAGHRPLSPVVMTRGNLVERIILPVLGVFLFVAELLTGGYSGDSWLPAVLWAGSFAAALIAAGFFPVIGGSAFFVVAIVEAALFSQMALPPAGLYALMAVYISRRWFLAAVVPVAVVDGMALYHSEYIGAEIVSCALGWILGLSLGFGALWAYRRIEQLDVDVLQAREKVHGEVSVWLHDTALRDLVRLSFVGESLSKQYPDNEDAMLVHELAREALRHLRTLMDRSVPVSLDPQNLNEVVQLCQTMLRARNITLAVELDETADRALSPQRRALLGLVIREGATNILKYSKEPSLADLRLDRGEDGGISLTMINQVADNLNYDSGVESGGFGLPSLHIEVEKDGGSLYWWERESSWILTAEFPGSLTVTGDSDEGL